MWYEFFNDVNGQQWLAIVDTNHDEMMQRFTQYPRAMRKDLYDTMFSHLNINLRNWKELNEGASFAMFVPIAVGDDDDD